MPDMMRVAPFFSGRLLRVLGRTFAFPLWSLLLAMGWLIGAPPMAAEAAAVVAQVDISRQRMIVSVNGVQRYNWPISTGRKGYVTPTGTYRPQRMHRTYFSRKYYNSPMPHSIFFRGGYAIHGSNAVSQLGRPASHGCVRLSPGHAAALYGLVQAHGSGNTLIRISR